MDSKNNGGYGNGYQSSADSYSSGDRGGYGKGGGGYDAGGYDRGYPWYC